MSTTSIELRPIHRDILKLIRTLCYEGLSKTSCALVDPNDRRLPLWEPNPYNSRFTLPDGVPEPLLRACLFVVPFDESEQRWGKDGHRLDPVLQYLIDRGLLDTSDDDRPICAAFRNYFNDSKILSTVGIEVNENGRFYVWQIPATSSALHEQNGSLVTGSPYRVFTLTERAHELLDAEKTAAEPAKPAVGKHAGKPATDPKQIPPAPLQADAPTTIDVTQNVAEATLRKPRAKRGRKPDTDPKEDKRIAEAWATGQYRTFADLERELELDKGEGKRAVDRHRKRK